MQDSKEDIDLRAAKMAKSTLCFECPDIVHRACSRRHNGGKDCVVLFRVYLTKYQRV